MPVERAVSGRVRYKEQALKIGPLSGRRNVGPCQHHALKNTESNVVVGGNDSSTIAGEKDQHWGRGGGASEMVDNKEEWEMCEEREREEGRGAGQNACTRSCLEATGGILSAFLG
jgi:hypothetical protein